MQQFNLSLWLQDKSRKIVTRRENPVRIICTDRKHGEDDLPIVFLENCHGGEFLLACRADGTCDNYETPYDLFFADEEEQNEFENTMISFAHAMFDHLLGVTKEIDIKEWKDKLLDLTRKELQPEFDKEMDKMLAETDKVVYQKGREDALKDLPKWKKMPNGIQGNGDFKPTYLVKSYGHYLITPCLSWDEDSMYLELAELENLPKE